MSTGLAAQIGLDNDDDRQRLRTPLKELNAQASPTAHADGTPSEQCVTDAAQT
jgi:hypothetical protein